MYVIKHIWVKDNHIFPIILLEMHKIYRTRAKIRLGLFKTHAVFGRAYLRNISKNAYFVPCLFKNLWKKFDATPHEVDHNLHFDNIGVKGIQNGLQFFSSEFIVTVSFILNIIYNE